MKIYVVEDEIIQLDDMLITLIELGHDCVGHSDDAFEALEQIETLQPEVVLMDIHLRGKQAGITLAKKVKTEFNIPIIFTSSDIGMSTMSEAIEVDPVSYITKPVNKNDLKAALLLAKNKLNNSFDNKNTIKEIFIKNGNKLVKVAINDILFAQTDSKNYCTIVTQNSKLSVRNSISGLKKILNHDTFIQTHRSYIINWKKVDSVVESDQSIQINEHQIPLGRSFKQEVFKRLQIV